MKIIFKTERTIPLTSMEERSRTVRIAVGVFLSHNVHTAAYITTRGIWGAFTLSGTGHVCQPGCGLKTELLGIAKALELTPQRPEYLNMAVTVPRTREFLDAIVSHGVIPQWDYTGVVPTYAEQLGRLNNLSWSADPLNLTESLPAARSVADKVHDFVLRHPKRSHLPKGILNDCCGYAEDVLCRV